MNGRYSKILRYAVSLSIAALLLWFSFRGVEWRDFLTGLETCRWGYVLISMAAGIAAFYLRGLRWRELLIPIDPSVKRKTAFNAVNIGYIANFVFPRIGEFVRCGVITGNLGNRKLATYDKVLGTVILERSWDMLSMMIFLFSLLVFKWNEFGAFFRDKMWLPLQESIHFSLWWVVLAVAAMVGACVWTVSRFKESNPFCGRLWSIGVGLLQGIGSCMKMERKWAFFAYTAAIWGLYWLMSASTMWALPSLSGLGLTDALFLMVAGSLGWIVPVPGGFGAFHFIVSLALSSIYGIPFEMGIIFATLSHESQAVTMAVCGGVSYLYESLRTSRTEESGAER